MIRGNLESSVHYARGGGTVRDGERTANKRPTVNLTEDNVRENVWSVYIASSETSDYSFSASTGFAYIAILTQESQTRPQVCDVY